MSDSPTDTRKKLRDLLEARAFRTGEITLSTGAKSNFYFDCKPVTLSADGAYLVGMAFLDALEKLPERPGAVGGLTHGADPIVSSMVALSYARECPIDGFYVRKEPKRHGTKRRLENPPQPGTKVVIVDDVVTSGGSLLKAVEEERAPPTAKSSPRWPSSTAANRTARPMSAGKSATTSRSTRGATSAGCRDRATRIVGRVARDP